MLALAGGVLLAIAGAVSHPYGLSHFFSLWYVYLGIVLVLMAGAVNLGMWIWYREHPPARTAAA
jgi:hypothetical protein